VDGVEEILLSSDAMNIRCAMIIVTCIHKRRMGMQQLMAGVNETEKGYEALCLSTFFSIFSNGDIRAVVSPWLKCLRSVALASRIKQILLKTESKLPKRSRFSRFMKDQLSF